MKKSIMAKKQARMAKKDSDLGMDSKMDKEILDKAPGVRPESMSPAGHESDEERYMKGKMDMATLMDAHAIKNDAKRMENIKMHHEKHMGAIKSFADLNSVYDAKYGEGALMKKKAKK